MQRMRKFVGLLSLASFVLVPVQLFADAQDQKPAVVGEAMSVGYTCQQDQEINPVYYHRMKKDAVENAESKCSWDNGRPVVTRISDWEITGECVFNDTGLSGYWDFKGTAKASFECSL